MALAAAEGLEAVTVRRLAEALSVTPMALYWHFRDKDALLAGVADRLWDETLAEVVATGPAAADGWAELRRLVDAVVTVLRRRPAVAALAEQRVMECESGLAVTERALGLLVSAGFSIEAACETAFVVLIDAVALVGSQPNPGDGASSEDDERRRRKRLALESLPAGRYPYITMGASFLTECTPGSYFDRGVDVIVNGVRSLVTGDPPTTDARRS
jgi:AcrR family transcriptional regulator